MQQYRIQANKMEAVNTGERFMATLQQLSAMQLPLKSTQFEAAWDWNKQETMKANLPTLPENWLVTVLNRSWGSVLTSKAPTFLRLEM
jgi:hypothetical protein